MSKGIASYPESMRRDVIERRLRFATGNGHSGAMDGARKLGIPMPQTKAEYKGEVSERKHRKKEGRYETAA